MAMIDVGDMSPAEVLMRLFNAAGAPRHAASMAWIVYRHDPMSIEQARALVEAHGPGYVDYFDGRIIKTDLGQRPVDTRLYDRDHGEGAGERALKGQLP
jgi:hypothetical protein